MDLLSLGITNLRKLDLRFKIFGGKNETLFQRLVPKIKQ